jgi:antitoxin ParD1/3/4
MSTENSEEIRINVRVRGPLAEHVQNLIGPAGLYESQSEYIRALIRRDMERRASAADDMTASILRSHEDILAGRTIESTGDFYKDKKLFDEKRKNGWK